VRRAPDDVFVLNTFGFVLRSSHPDEALEAYSRILEIDPEDTDAMWQLVGFYLGWTGAPGRGRALGCAEVKFSGQVLPKHKKITYHIDIKRTIMRQLVLGIADGTMSVDGKAIYHGTDLKVGLFASTDQF